MYALFRSKNHKVERIMTNSKSMPPGARPAPAGVPTGSHGQPAPSNVPSRSSNNGGGDFMKTAVEWGFKILAFPLWLTTTIFHSMLQPGAAGATFLGRLTFVFLTVLSADGIWQLIFRQKALFPWYAESWIGWGWLPGLEIQFRHFHVGFSLGILANPLFYIAVCISMIIQLIESAVIFGDRFSGVNDRILGFAAIACFTFEIISGFATRNPLRYSEPGDVVKCTIYIVFTICCAELGRWGEKILSGRR
jgi:hypothetical protein